MRLEDRNLYVYRVTLEGRYYNLALYEFKQLVNLYGIDIDMHRLNDRVYLVSSRQPLDHIILRSAGIMEAQLILGADPFEIDWYRIFHTYSSTMGGGIPFTYKIEGIENAKYDRVIVMDGDFSHDPKDVKKLLKVLKHSDLVIGSKYVKGARDESPPLRKLISRTANLLAKFLLGFKVKDCISGFFGFKKVRGIKLRGIGFKLSTELLFKLRGKTKVEEVPINFRKRKYGKSKFSLFEIFKFLILLLRLKFKLFYITVLYKRFFNN